MKNVLNLCLSALYIELLISAEDKHALDVAKKEVYTAVKTAQESQVTRVNC